MPALTDPRRILLEPKPIVETISFEVPTTQHLAIHGFTATYRICCLPNNLFPAEEPGKAREVYEALLEAIVGTKQPDDDEAVHRGSAYVELLDPAGSNFVVTMLASVPTWPPPALAWPPEMGRINIPSHFDGPEYYDVTVPDGAGARHGIACDGRPWTLTAHFPRAIDGAHLGFWIYGIPKEWACRR